MFRGKTILITGAAGFIGSYLASAFLEKGAKVIGIDCLTENYNPKYKEKNLSFLLKNSKFFLIRENLLTVDLDSLEVPYAVFHQAGQPGVRPSWGKKFKDYMETNIGATQRLLEKAKTWDGLHRFVYASSSSVYGDDCKLPFSEEQRPGPISPYGVTKLAAEHLCMAYYHQEKLPVTCFRYFTVYGPRQRPDMAIHIFMKAALEDHLIRIFGDGEQTRDFTFVKDIVDANIAALTHNAVGEVMNLGGGTTIRLRTLIEKIEELSGRKIRQEIMPFAPGDVRHTEADTSLARRLLGFSPKVSLEEGLKQEWNWVCDLNQNGFGS